MIELGMNGIRLNCSHVSLVDAKEWIDALHEAMEITKKHVELVVDLKGPEIRVLHLKEKIRILPGEMIKIEETFDLPALVKEKIDYQDQLQVDDGKLLFEVKKKDEEGILLETIRGGTLYPHKSVAIETICRKANKPYMIVTQLLEMVSLKGIPSRAEVDDIFHAIYQGASSIMLTGEVANSKYAKEAMHILCEVSENTLQYKYKER